MDGFAPNNFINTVTVYSLQLAVYSERLKAKQGGDNYSSCAIVYELDGFDELAVNCTLLAV